ncbi:hypothetical protein BpHYR1_034267 [Brachionus plicatilis]|uniref:Uncharacterized protein n=1 Tax=Brachionus plicatilis TaxID=10195 RepID=A0A3M7R5C7_BRAPC|nr:hypothetical protein BpHYR1_034267 [Brachionus plicatilis]
MSIKNKICLFRFITLFYRLLNQKKCHFEGFSHSENSCNKPKGENKEKNKLIDLSLRSFGKLFLIANHTWPETFKIQLCQFLRVLDIKKLIFINKSGKKVREIIKQLIVELIISSSCTFLGDDSDLLQSFECIDLILPNHIKIKINKFIFKNESTFYDIKRMKSFNVVIHQEMQT